MVRAIIKAVITRILKVLEVLQQQSKNDAICDDVRSNDNSSEILELRVNNLKLGSLYLIIPSIYNCLPAIVIDDSYFRPVVAMVTSIDSVQNLFSLYVIYVDKYYFDKRTWLDSMLSLDPTKETPFSTVITRKKDTIYRDVLKIINHTSNQQFSTAIRIGKSILDFHTKKHKYGKQIIETLRVSPIGRVMNISKWPKEAIRDWASNHLHLFKGLPDIFLLKDKKEIVEAVQKHFICCNNNFIYRDNKKDEKTIKEKFTQGSIITQDGIIFHSPSYQHYRLKRLSQAYAKPRHIDRHIGRTETISEYLDEGTKNNEDDIPF